VIILVVIFIAGIWFGLIAPHWLGLKSTPKIYGTATVVRQVQTLSELITVKYVMEKVIIFEDTRWYPGGDTRFLFIAHGVVKAGLDLKDLKPGDIEVSGKTISVRLPPSHITDAYLDDSRSKVIERSTGIFTPYDKNLEQTARQNAVDDIRRSART